MQDLKKQFQQFAISLGTQFPSLDHDIMQSVTNMVKNRGIVTMHSHQIDNHWEKLRLIDILVTTSLLPKIRESEHFIDIKKAFFSAMHQLIEQTQTEGPNDELFGRFMQKLNDKDEDPEQLVLPN